MQGTADDILKLEGNLTRLYKTPITLTGVIDANVEEPGPISGGENQSEQFIRGWIKQHPNNKPGNIAVKITARTGPESGWLDPVNVLGAGLLPYIDQHS